MIEIKNRYTNKVILKLDLDTLMDADLSYADLSYANLYNADLSHANLYNADLSHTNLYRTILCDVNLNNALITYRGNSVKIKFEEVKEKK